MTSYSNIYSVFLQKIYDISLANDLIVNTIVAESQMESWMLSSIVRFDRCKQDLSNRDKILKQFNITLNDTEIEILSLFMVVEWLRPMVNNILNLKPLLNDNEFKGFSNANFLDKKQQLLQGNESDAYGMMGRYDENNNDYTQFN